MRYARTAAALLLLAPLPACGGGGDVTPPPPRVAAVTVTPPAPTIATIGGTQQLTATPRDASGNALSGRAAPVWSVASGSAVAVNPATGLVMALAQGQATVRATIEGVSGDATVTVQLPPPPPDVEVVVASGRLERGAAVALRITSNGAEVAPGGYTLTANPADGAQITGATARLLRTGRVALIAQVGAERDSVVVDVAAPPVVVFERLASGERDIYRVSLDGGDTLRLSSRATDDRAPAVAAGRVVFVSYRDGNGELYSVPLAGGAETRLTTTAANEGDPALRADGSRLAFTSDVASGVPKLYTAAADATGAARATEGIGIAGAVEATPSWNPAGDRVVYMSTATGGTAAIHRLIVETGDDSVASPAGLVSVEPAWSPDGRRVAFAGEVEGGDSELFVLDLVSGQLTRLTTRAGLDAQPSWLADGRLVYAAMVGGVMRLRWLDPAAPAVVHDIDTGPGSASRPAGVR